MLSRRHHPARRQSIDTNSVQLSPRIVLFTARSQVPVLPEGSLGLGQIPSAAFGDGSHPTTRLCAGAVDFLCRQKPQSRVLDVGTGTGVLARIARANGSPFIAATDIDPQALHAARANSALDGSVVEIIFSDDSPDHWGPRFDLVVANILEGPLRALKPALIAALAPRGILLLSGFTRLQVPALRAGFEDAGLTYVSESSLEEWTLLQFQRLTF